MHCLCMNKKMALFSEQLPPPHHSHPHSSQWLPLHLHLWTFLPTTHRFNGCPLTPPPPPLTPPLCFLPGIVRPCQRLFVISADLTPAPSLCLDCGVWFPVFPQLISSFLCRPPSPNLTEMLLYCIFFPVRKYYFEVISPKRTENP